MFRYSDIIRDDRTQAVIPEVSVTVSASDTGALAVLEDDDGNPLDNPIESDELGEIAFNIDDGYYDFAYRYGGRLYQRDFGKLLGTVPVETGLIADAMGEGTTIAPSQRAVSQAFTILKARFGANPRDFGAVGDGVTDDTAAFQAAINSGVTHVKFDDSPYVVSSLLMPNVFGFLFEGPGPSGLLKQKAGASGALFRWSTAAMVYNEQTIGNISVDGGAGTQHCIDTSGGGGLTIDGVYFKNLPVGKSGILVDGAAATQTHDVRLLNIQAYPNNAAHSGIRFGPLAADSSLEDFIMHGNFVTNYCIYADIGAVAIDVSDSHPYAAAVNVLKMAGSNSYWTFDNVTIDNATENLVEIDASSHIEFNGCYFEAIQAGKIGVNITGVSGDISFDGVKWQGSVGAASCIVAGGSTAGIKATGGGIAAVADFSAPFVLPGVQSYARGISGWKPLGLLWSVGGTQAVAQAQATTQYLGNGSAATEVNAEYLVPFDSFLNSVTIEVDVTPVAGQTRTFRARKNGADIGVALVLHNGDFGGTITLGNTFSQFESFSISSINSATSGSSSARWTSEWEA